MTLTRLLLIAFALGLPTLAMAQPVVLVLKDHRFETPQITVPAGQTIRIELRNQDSSVDEFDSSDLKVEEDLMPHSLTAFNIGPLKPGAYRFMGEAHPNTASGVIIAK